MCEIPSLSSELRRLIDALLGRMFPGDDLVGHIRLHRGELEQRLPGAATPEIYRAALLEVLEHDGGALAVGQMLGQCMTLSNKRRFRSEILRIIQQLGIRPDSARNCPYPGLLAFAEEDSGRFFGRNQEIEELLDRALAGRWLWVDGASGVGKSSVVCAGLLPRLRQESSATVVARLRPGPFPLESLARAVVRALQPDGDIEALRASMVADPASLRRFIADRLATGGRFVLVVDQLEELLTFAAPEQVRQFDQALAGALAGTDCDFRLISTIRSDQAGALQAALGEVGRQINQPWVKRYTVLPLDAVDLEEVIEDPLLGTGVSFEVGLATRIRRDAMAGLVGTSDGCLPLLALALRELWFACTSGGSELTHEAYDRLGGMAGALSRSAEEALERLLALDPEQPDGVKRLLLALTTVDRHSRWSRQTLLRRQALEALHSRRAELVLAGLTGQVTGASAGSMRLIVTWESAGQARVDLIHEALLTQWPRLKGWLAEAEEEKRNSQLLLVAAREWTQYTELPRGRKGEMLLAARPADEEPKLCKQFQAALRRAHEVRRNMICLGVVLACGFIAALVIESYLAVTHRWKAEAMVDELNEVVRQRDDSVKALETAKAAAEEGRKEARAAEALAKKHRAANQILLEGSLSEAAALVEGEREPRRPGSHAARADRATALLTSVQTAIAISQSDAADREPTHVCREKLDRAEALDPTRGESDGQTVLEVVECYRNLTRIYANDTAIRRTIEQDSARIMTVLERQATRETPSHSALVLNRMRDVALDPGVLQRVDRLAEARALDRRGEAQFVPSPGEAREGSIERPTREQEGLGARTGQERDLQEPALEQDEQGRLDRLRVQPGRMLR